MDLFIYRVSVHLSVGRAVYVFQWSPRQHVVCQVEDPKSSPQYAFLPSWYTGDSTVCRTDDPPEGSTGPGAESARVCQLEDPKSSQQHVFLPSWYTGDSAIPRTDETWRDS